MMRTLLEQKPAIDTIAGVDVKPPATGEPEAYEDYVPDVRGAPRSARRIAMLSRREEDRRLGGW
jgi:hypothetical protein